MGHEEWNTTLFYFNVRLILFFALACPTKKNPIQADFDLLLLGFKFVQMGQ